MKSIFSSDVIIILDNETSPIVLREFLLALNLTMNNLNKSCTSKSTLGPNLSNEIKGHEIKNNAWVTVNNDFFVTSEAIRQWFSRVTKSRVKIIAESPHEWQKIVIHGNECIILFLTRYFMSWTHKSAIIERSFRHCCQGRPFLTEHCDVTTIDLWRHANAKYWYCDVIFVYCHCTRKLAQRRSSLVNNSREYRYLATRYSRHSV